MVYDQSDPELGIVFEDVPEDLTGDAADVYNTLALYEVEYWRSLTTNEVSPLIPTIGSAEVLDEFEWFTSENAADEAEVGGTFRATVSEVEVSGDTATALTCDNYADVTFADKDGEYTPAEANFGEPRLARVELDRMAAEGQWQIRTTKRTGEC